MSEKNTYIDEKLQKICLPNNVDIPMRRPKFLFIWNRPSKCFFDNFKKL